MGAKKREWCELNYGDWGTHEMRVWSSKTKDPCFALISLTNRNTCLSVNCSYFSFGLFFKNADGNYNRD